MERAAEIPVSISENRLRVAEGKGTVLKQRLTTLALVFSDLILASLVWVAAFGLQGLQGAFSEVTAAIILPATLIWVVLRALLGLYPGYGLDQVEELRRQTYAVLATLGMATMLGIFSHVGGYVSRLVLLLGFVGLLLLAPLVRYFTKRALLSIGLWGKPVVILGNGETGVEVLRLLKREWHLGYKPVAIFDSITAPVAGSLEGVHYGGALTDAIFSDWKKVADTAIFAMPYTRRERLAKYVAWASDKFQHVVIIPNLSGVTNSAVVARDLAGTFGVEIRYNLLNPWALRSKRLIDLLATITGGVLISPLLFTIFVCVWVESRGQVFYKDRRMGKNNELFSCVKFRTMIPDAEAKLQQILEENSEMREEYSKYHKLRDDPRVTRIGWFLRKTSLDELPQLWNVLRGEMSLVGPRPYLPRESEDIGSTQREILRVSPGISGPWQVSGRSSSSFEERVLMDAHYVRDWSVWLDIVLLARTVRSVLLRSGAY